MLVYPGWLSVLDRARIDQALTTHDAPWDGEGAWIGRRYPSETATVQAVLAVLAVIVATLEAHLDQAADVRQRATQDLLEQIIVRAGSSSPYRDRLDDLATAVRLELPTQPALATPSAVPTDDRVPLSITEAAQRLGVSDDTISRLGKSGKLIVVTIGKKLKRIPQAEIDRLLRTGQYPKH